MTIVTFIPSGRLGNLLFMVFNTIAYAIVYDLEFNFNENYEHNYWDTAFKYLKQYSIYGFPKLKNYIIKENGHQYQQLPSPDKDYHLIKLKGYFQSYKYFDEYKTKIFEIFKLDTHLQECRSYIYAQFGKEFLNKLEKSTAMHFRMGDYKSTGLPILPISYYIEAIKYLSTHANLNDIIYFVEKENINDILPIIKELSDIYPTLNWISAPPDQTPWNTLLMMSFAQNNIVANSSFSYWAAYFNQNQHKLITYPYPWLFNPSTDICPPSWHRITLK